MDTAEVVASESESVKVCLLSFAGVSARGDYLSTSAPSQPFSVPMHAMDYLTLRVRYLQNQSSLYYVTMYCTVAFSPQSCMTMKV